jgi:hypothetical protein
VAEQLEDLFAELRADTMGQLRPPGADRVRRTVRRRRTTTAAFAGVLLVVLGGTVALLGFPSRHPAPATADTLSQAELDRLTGVADQAVQAGNPGPAVFARRGPVLGLISATEQIYLGEIELQVACAGTGSVTLLVRGRPSAESGSTERAEVARLTARCSAEPVPAGTTFVLGQYLDITVELVDADSARGRAGFAYRATSDTGQPVPRDGSDPTGALRLPEPLPAGSAWGGSGNATDQGAGTGWEPLDGDFRLAVACAGTGTLRILVRQARSAADPDGTVVGKQSFEATCQLPPQRQDFVLGVVRDRQVSLSWSHESTSSAPVDIAYQLLPR